MVLNSFAVSTCWNIAVDAEDNEERRMSLLEGAGITAFAYVVIVAFRYGSKRDVGMLASIRPTIGMKFHTREQMKESCSGLTAEQKAALKQTLVEHCGCKESACASESTKSSDTSNTTIQ